MANFFAVSLFLYFVPLMLTQTDLFSGVSNLRWYGLATASLVGLGAWLVARRRPVDGTFAMSATAIYLLFTGVSRLRSRSNKASSKTTI